MSRSTEIALYSLVNSIEKALDSNEIVMGIFVGIERLFITSHEVPFIRLYLQRVY